MDASVLEGIGLTKGEIKTYLALLELGSSNAGKIIEKAGLQSSVVHNCLHKLINKGLITYILKGKIRTYQAANPKTLVTFIEEKKKTVESLLPELLLKQTLSQNKQEAEIYEGLNGFKAMSYQMISEGKKGDEFLFFCFEGKVYVEEVYAFYNKFEQHRKEIGIKVRGIAPKSSKKYLDKRKHSKIKYVDFPIPSNISIFNDYVGLTAFEDKPMCLLIKSRVLATVFRNYFESVWKN